ncbi:MAG: glycosyltransferase family 4 protein [Prevotella sp.]|nr:glycosyltransferase family 4 protein [Prevotella sp.]
MENAPLKLVYVTPAIYSAGGVERVVTVKANYFVEVLGYDVTIIVTEGKGRSSFFPLSDRVHVVNFELGFEELWNVAFCKKTYLYLKKIRKYKRLLRAELLRIRPDITISTLRREINFINDIKDGSKKIGELHVNRANYRSVKTEKSSLIKKMFARFWSDSLVSHLKKLDGFVVLTEKDKEAWTELDQVEVIPDPIPFVPTTFSQLTEKRVLAVTRYSYEKGIDLLLEAWAQVEKQTEEWRLDVYGNGDTTAFNALIDKLGIDRNRCQLHGYTCDVEKEYTNSSIFVCSSRFEGFGMVIVEAMACGLPVVSFDCPWGPRSIINDHEYGILVEKDNPTALAQGILSLVNDAALRMTLSGAAKRNVQSYKMEYIAAQWNRLFEDIQHK